MIGSLFRGMTRRDLLLFAFVAVLYIGTAYVQSWNTVLGMVNLALISAIMALGVNMQWGYAGLLNVGVMGFVALGGLASVLVSVPPTDEAVSAGGLQIVIALLLGAATVAAAVVAWGKMPPSRARGFAVAGILLVGFFIFRAVFDPAVARVEAVNPASTGYLGGLHLPVVLSWPVGGLFAAGAAWIIGKSALRLRSDYLAIATLGISEIIIAILKN